MEEFYNLDARKRFLPPESVDLFLTHPPYFKIHSEAYGNAEGQMQDANDIHAFVENLITVVKNMEYSLKPNGTIVIGFPTNQVMYEFIAKIVTRTSLQFGNCFFWDFKNVTKVNGDENNLFMTLFKKSQYVNYGYKVDSFIIDIPWVLSEDLKEKSHIAFVNDAWPEELCEIFINRYSAPGDVVADLMAGTGTALKAAKRLNRKIIYNDVSEKQLKLAKVIINNEKEDPMDLKRKEVVEMMTKEIQEMNVKMMANMNLPSEQVQDYLEKSVAELQHVNGILFDMLVKNGVIR